MDSIHKLEDMIEGWFKPLPHLPAAGRKWLAENLWWITLVGVILAAWAALTAYQSLSYLDNLNSAFGGLVGNIIAQNNGQFWQTSVYISIALLTVTAVIEAIAISPLKAMSKKGWDLMFLATIVGVASSLVSGILNAQISGIFGAIIGAAIGAYLLFEIRSSFSSAK